MANIPSSPGRPRIKCMIWEPQPINVRPVQDLAMVHNSATIQSLPPDKKFALEPFDGEPQSIILKRKYHYRHTWLMLPSGNNAFKQITTGQSIFSGYFSDANATVAATPEVQHQMFTALGSMFSTTVQNVVMVDGNNVKTNVQQPPNVAVFSYQTKSTISENILDFTNSTTGGNASGTQQTDTHMPSNIALYVNAATAGTPNTTTGSTTASAAVTPNTPIHWLCEKQQPVYQREDFWVEFWREAHTFDNPPPSGGGKTFYTDPKNASLGIIKDYSSLNPYAGISTTSVSGGASTSVYTNRAVVDFQTNTDGTESPVESSLTKLDLSLQAYYMIEMGGPTEQTHRYIILIPFQDYPRFIHIGTVGLPTIDPTKGLSVVNCQNVSRNLSTYNVDSRSLMDQNQLRVTVRNHLGRIVVYFSGHEDNPWVINRSDLQVTQTASNTTSATNNTNANSDQTAPQNPSNFQNVFVPMIVPNKTVRIGGGNGKVSWCFAPLHYQDLQEFTLPQVIAVRGPATDDNINLYLREKANADFAIATSSNPTPVFFQYAEVYNEQIGSSIVSTSRSKTLPPQPTNVTAANATSEIAPKKDQNNTSGSGNRPVNGNGEALATIQVTRQSTIAATGNPVNKNANGSTTPSSGAGSTASNNNTGQTTSGPLDPATDTSFYVRFFYAKYSMYSGDYKFAAIGGLKAFDLTSSITPISTGWRVNVPAGGGPTNYLDAVDVSHHVSKASVNQTYTDLTRCDSTGNISFHIPNGIQPSVDGDGVLQPDQSAFIAALVNKTFTIRLYAWWEGGYMQCSGNCENPTCCSCDYKNLKNCALFTGIVHGGVITEQSGRKVMECQMSDYWKILADSQFLNCPFYDGARDYNAVYDILQQVGFHDGTEVDNSNFDDPWAPAALLSAQAAHQTPPQWQMSFNGKTLYCSEFALPSAYDILQSPVLKFADNSHMDEGIMKIISLSGKVGYFDQFGVFHMDMRPDVAIGDGFVTSPKLTFYASPLDLPDYCAINALSQILIDSFNYRRAAADVYNEIQIISTTPQGELIVGNDVNYASKFDPTSEGYLGYTKRLLQQDGVFGSSLAVENVINYYKGAYVPAILISFKAIGTSKLKPMDLVRVVGLSDDGSFTFPPQLTMPPNGSADVIVTSVTHELSASQSVVSWDMNVETEWVFTGSPANG